MFVIYLKLTSVFWAKNRQKQSWQSPGRWLMTVTPVSSVTLGACVAPAGDDHIEVSGALSAGEGHADHALGALRNGIVGPTVLTGGAPLTQAIYYAENISAALAGANVVNLTFKW
ncbi:MAG: hypothetical protein JOZ50_11565 [Candidatus Eremiobacteraeota bacterium]|nr:hypothetical protein [Verrucomicrobiota bacterium]MBV8596870.1 hypothetical protein [Candidatus Eremiobacteraeota bacterium]